MSSFTAFYRGHLGSAPINQRLLMGNFCSRQLAPGLIFLAMSAVREGMFEPSGGVIKLSNHSESRFAENIAEAGLGVVDEVKIAPLAQKIIGKYGASISAKAMIGKHNCDRLQRFYLLQQPPQQLIEFAITFSDLLDSAVLIRPIAASFLYIVPELVLNPVRLLKVDHAHVPLVFLEQKTR